MISSEVKEWLVFGAFIILLSIFPITRVSGFSMLPSYQENDLVIAQRFVSNIERGDVIICKTEVDGVNKRLIKRVVGIPGDEISEVQGWLLINGIPVGHSQFGGYSYNLNETQFFIVGDNEENSVDSRYFGPISREEIIGKVIIKTE